MSVKKHKSILVFAFFLVITGFLFLTNAEAAKLPNLGNINQEFTNTTDAAGLTLDSGSRVTVYGAIGFWLQLIISFVGVILLLFFLYAGWLWLTAQGNEEQITKAKDLLKGSIIATLIIFFAYVLTTAILGTISNF